MKRCCLIAFFAVAAGLFPVRTVLAASPTNTVSPSAATHASKDLAIDLGDGVTMELVWIPNLYSLAERWVGKYEVTNGEYRKFKADHDSGECKGQSLNGDRQPVVAVNFEDAKAFANWLSEREEKAGRLPKGYYYRLPSEDAWLTFAQCGDGREYPWGNSWPPKYGNYADETIGEVLGKDWGIIFGYRDGYALTCPVEESGKNDWGLCGVGGNV
ncbi:MAG: SUMF1/EgtB/PvdO family nonheme iron enzyme [Lentisphaerae bacterium]|nr:SUMF1/EgtB/PvdO family nonheme iron enzyme [Lentisphaerota bacterium]